MSGETWRWDAANRIITNNYNSMRGLPPYQPAGGEETSQYSPARRNRMADPMSAQPSGCMGACSTTSQCVALHFPCMTVCVHTFLILLHLTLSCESALSVTFTGCDTSTRGPATDALLPTTIVLWAVLHMQSMA